MTWLLLIFACNGPASAPAIVQTTPSPKATLIEAGEVEGILVEGVTSTQGILLLVEKIDAISAARAQSLSPSTVLAIAPSTPTTAAKAYLEAFPQVSKVTVLCDRADCPGLRAESGPPTSPARKLFQQRGQSQD